MRRRVLALSVEEFCFPRGSFLPRSLWFSTLHFMVGEIGADGRYVVCTSLPHFMLGRLGGGMFRVFLGNVEIYPLVQSPVSCEP